MTLINPYSDEWLTVQKHTQVRLRELRENLESLQCDPRRADQLRGGIEELTELLKLAEPVVDASTDDDDGFIFQY